MKYGNIYQDESHDTPPPPNRAVPPLVGKLFSRLPAWPGSVLFVSALNLVFAPQLPADVAAALQNRRLRMHVRDAHIVFDFALVGAAFTACPPSSAPADVTIAATAADFLALARREQDPDTLFFNRRLSMQGDTELGLMVKNLLDSLELPVFDLKQTRPPKPSTLAASLLAAVRKAPPARHEHK